MSLDDETPTPEKSAIELETSEVYEYFLTSDLQTALEPGPSDIGFARAPRRFEIVETRWDGLFSPAGTLVDADGDTLTNYDVGQDVDFVAELPDDIVLEEGWRVEGPPTGGYLRVEGELSMVATLSVFFEEDAGLTIPSISWRRADGMGPGEDLAVGDPSSALLF